FVMPSRHEGFCMPVLEAMAHGVPVIAARAGALPETIGNAGLSFTPDDPDDLAAKIRSVLLKQPSRSTAAQPKKIAIVATQFAPDILGGAERSLRLIAELLAANGWSVEVFTTGSCEETEVARGIRIHRFPADTVDEPALHAATQALRQGGEIREIAILDYLQ